MAQVQPPARARVSPAVVTLPAEIDMANADRVGADLQAALAPGVTAVVADMTATTFCDSRGIHALVLAHQRATACGAELRSAPIRSGHHQAEQAPDEVAQALLEFLAGPVKR